MKINRTLFLSAITALASLPALAVVPIVRTVPWDAANDPHTAITGVAIVLGATADLQGSSDSFTYSWNFGDGSAATAPAAVTNPYNISATHSYTGAAGQTWTAVVTVRDTTSGQSATGSYPVILGVNSLASRVNVAIDKGLWFLHTSMWRTNTPANSQPVNWGGWDTLTGGSCVSSFDCTSYGGLDATNVQAFEVSGHFENGPATDPYTDDVARGLARMEYFLAAHAINYGGAKSFAINPALHASRCSDGSVPTGYPGAAQSCTAPATLIKEIPSASSCTAPPCAVTFDQNSNGQLLNIENDSGDPGYQLGMFVDAFVATANGAGTAKAGVVGSGGLPGVRGQTYLNIVTDLTDTITYCQNPYDPYSGGSNGYDDGGGWEYTCAVNSQPYYNDNSPSQWNAVGLVGASSGFGLTIPQITKDMNQVWMTWSQDWVGLSTYPDKGKGAYGYSEYNYYPWGPYADTPSGMVQLVMDGVGRTASGATDQRWNMAETFYRDAFCNATAGGSTASPRAYTYGMFSFTKAMLLHSPGGVLTPIKFLADQPSGSSPIDWYGAQAASGDPCDGVAQTLVTLQAPADGHWYGNDYYGTQYYFETGWSIIMLQKTVFNACPSDLTGAGTAGGRAHPARVDLTWTALPASANIAHYNILRGTSSGGPFTLEGSSTLPAYTDTNGLSNNGTYYYVLQALLSTGAQYCQSTNPAQITVP